MKPGTINITVATCSVINLFNLMVEEVFSLQEVYTRCKRVFANLPLAALIQQQALVLHGGLFRSPPQTSKLAKNKRKRANPILLGTFWKLVITMGRLLFYTANEPGTLSDATDYQAILTSNCRLCSSTWYLG